MLAQHEHNLVQHLILGRMGKVPDGILREVLT